MSLLRTSRDRMTLAEFLDWEDGQEVKHEFDGHGPVAMAGGTIAHGVIQRNLAISLGSRLRGKPCQSYGSDIKVQVIGHIRYPDGMVSCTSQPPDGKILRAPVVLFEVLSESSGSTDLVTKNHEYASTASVRRYVVLAQDRIGGTMFERAGEDWVGHLIVAETILRMPEIGIEVPVAELYEGLAFGPDGLPADPVSAAPSP